MAEPTAKEKINALKNREGIFGMGFSLNNNLDLMNLVVLACSGIIIKLFFQENYSKLGNVGPASTTIWGYGLTALALFLMIFMSIYLSKSTSKFRLENTENMFTYYLDLIMNNTLPIILLFGVIMYIIILNFLYYKRINSNLVSDSYHVYTFYISLLLILQISLIVKFMYNSLQKINTDGKLDFDKQNSLIKSASYIVVVINFIFVLMNHILLAFFSTDG
tara:strand:- start:1503 stop:2162 length:660 start_codon:yes stop_codon:yes gene_type:complete